MTPVEFTLDHVPVPAARPRISKSGRVFYPSAHTKYHQFLKTHLETKPGFKTSGLVRLSMVFVLPPYKTSDYPTHRSDVDNLSKLPMDVMTQSGRYWEDDNLVSQMVVLKRFAVEGEAPHTAVRIEEVPEWLKTLRQTLSNVRGLLEFLTQRRQ